MDRVSGFGRGAALVAGSGLMRWAVVADRFALAIIFDYKFSLLEIPLPPA
jgi:hypothetical protein